MLPVSNKQSSAATSGDSSLAQSGALFHASGNGDWNVNMGGASVQGGSSWLLIGAGLLVAWLVFRKK